MKDKDDNYNIINENFSKKNKNDIIKRDDKWDNYKGILTFLIVFSHFLYCYIENNDETIINQIYIFLSIFHIPAFIFCSGFFSKSNRTKNIENIFKLIIVYFILNTSLMIFMYFIFNEELNFFMPYYSNWYILSLIYWKTIILYIDFENQNNILLKTIIFSLINGYSIIFSNNLLSIRRTITFFPFFIIGYLLTKENIESIFSFINNSKKKYSYIFFIIYSFGLFLCIKNKIINFTLDQLFMKQYLNFFDIKKRLLIFILAFIMSLSLLLIIPNRKIPFLTKSGKNSLNIFLFHIVVPLFLKKYYRPKLSINKILFYGFIESIVIMIIFGNDLIKNKIKEIINYIYINVANNTKKGKKIIILYVFILFLIIFSNPIKTQFKLFKLKPITKNYNTNITSKKKYKIENNTFNNISENINITNDKINNTNENNLELQSINFKIENPEKKELNIINETKIPLTNISKIEIPENKNLETIINNKNKAKKNKKPKKKNKTIELNNYTTHLLTNTLKQKLESSIKISYIGDLILLKKQVISAYNKTTKKYDFNDMFKYTKEYFKKSDLTIGVFEGPAAGGGKDNYSNSNYNDKVKALRLNYPDEFVEAIKNSGINFVTTANNHLLDKKIEGALRTIDILDKYNLTHIGSYRNDKEKYDNEIKIINIKNIKIAFLSYTQFVNYHSTEKLFKNYNYISSFIPLGKFKIYDKMLEKIKNDIKRAKNTKADLIAVFLHMGEQFLHKPDKFQRKWNKIFTDLGVDIILGDHSHAVQTIEYVNNNKTLIINCPGNYANSYIEKDGDSTSIVELYIDKDTKKVIGSSIIPMYTFEIRKDYFIALPIYNVVTKNKFYDKVNEKQMKRIKEIQELCTKVMIGNEISINEVKERYYFINNSYYAEMNFMNVVNKYKNKLFYKLINESDNITFIGDSITEGNKNNFHPWFEPLVHCFDNKKIINISKGSYTTKLILKKFKSHILHSHSQLYIIAIGTNDIRYRKKNECAMNKDDFIIEINKIVNLIKESYSNSKIVFIAPWMSLSNDVVKLKGKEKEKLFNEYNLSLKEYCEKNNYLFINPNIYLEKILNGENIKKYMNDYIHPNKNDGIELYSEAVLIMSK